MEYSKLIFLLIGIHLATVTSKHVRFFRREYIYVAEFDAFYRLHVAYNGSWTTAFLTCENETTQLFYPSEEEEWRIVEKVRSETAASNVTDVLIGVHDQFNLGEFFTAEVVKNCCKTGDGKSLPRTLSDDLKHVEAGGACVTLDSVTGAYKKGPCTRGSPTLFVCKKINPRPCPPLDCPTSDTDYIKYWKTSKCYKINKEAKTWQDALKTCYAEGALLTMFQDGEETKDIEDFLHGTLRLNRHTSHFIGVHDLYNDGVHNFTQFYTIGGKHIGALPLRSEQDLQDNVLSNETPSIPEYDLQFDDFGNPIRVPKTVPKPPEPTSLTSLARTLPGGSHLCGIVTHSKIEAVSCHIELPFICEMKTN